MYIFFAILKYIYERNIANGNKLYLPVFSSSDADFQSYIMLINMRIVSTTNIKNQNELNNNNKTIIVLNIVHE